MSPSALAPKYTLAILHDDVEHARSVDEAVLVADDIHVLEVAEALDFCFDVLAVLRIEVLDLELLHDEGAAAYAVPR